MKILTFERFIADFGKITKHRMNMSMYSDSFECACGSTHWFDQPIEIIGDGFWKVIVVCPDTGRHITSLKIKTTFGFGFKGFDSLAGAMLETPDDLLLLSATRAAAML